MSDSNISAAYYFLREIGRHVTAMGLTTNPVVSDFHGKCAHDAIEHALTYLASSTK